MTDNAIRSDTTSLSLVIKKDRCNLCVVCMHACPTKAIRIRDNDLVILPDLCVDCGECMRTCPQRAIVPKVSTYRDMARYKVTAALPSPVIYTQFGEDVMPNDILLALSKLGFDHVFDLARYCEWGNLALKFWMEDHPEIRTAISTVCPVVIRLITKRFPSLIPNIVKQDSPREVGAKHVRRIIRRKLNLSDEEIGIFYVTPCAAKMEDINHPLTSKHSHLDGALGLHDIFGDIIKAFKTLTDEDRETVLFNSGGFGISWEMSGAETYTPFKVERYLSVSGINDTLDVLDQIESGRLAGVRYVDCRICPDGCLGGPLTVENRHMARATLSRLIQMFGTLPRVSPREIATLVKQGFFDMDKEIKSGVTPLHENPVEAMKTLRMMDRLTGLLPGKRCGVCGAPDCRTLAEDVVLGQARMTDCPFYNKEDES